MAHEVKWIAGAHGGIQAITVRSTNLVRVWRGSWRFKRVPGGVCTDTAWANEGFERVQLTEDSSKAGPIQVEMSFNTQNSVNGSGLDTQSGTYRNNAAWLYTA